jgi:inositol polyphosphate 5-phosphatase INPP5B/F
VTTLHSWLSHDQLRTQQKLGKVFHEGWREGEINFLPTYKYDIGSVAMFDSGEKKRGPSWCDRILYRTRTDRLRYEEKAKRDAEAKRKDEEMKKRGLDQDAAEQDVLFDYDPDTDGLAYGDDYDEEADEIHDAELVETHEGYEDEIELDHYVSHQRVLSSDHKPLGAIFTLTYDAAIPELKAKVHQEVARLLDKEENEGRPAITVVADSHDQDLESDADDAVEQSDTNYVHFGQVRYGVIKQRSITVANTGRSAATFNFIGKEPDEPKSRISAPWLHVEPLAEHSIAEQPRPLEGALSYEYTLSPGETRTIQITIDISEPGLVVELNHSVGKLDDVLILRVKDGRDHFVPVKGKWLPTCFYRTLDELVVAPEGGVRAIPRSAKNRDATGTDGVKSSATHHSAPKELFELTESIPSLVERSVAEWRVLHPDRTPPWKHEGDFTPWPFDASTWTFHSGEERSKLLEDIRDRLDTSISVNEPTSPDESCLVHLETLAETLIHFLRSLRDGVITATMWTLIEQSLIATEKDKSLPSAEDIQAMVMDPLSSAPVHSVSMTFITFMLMRIIKEVIPTGKDDLQSPPSPNASRRSRASSMLSDPDSETSASPSISSAHKFPSLFLDRLKRRRGQSTSTGGVSTEVENVSSASDKRKTLANDYAALFAPLMIRSARDETVKGREKKVLEARKKKVLEAFLDAA